MARGVIALLHLAALAAYLGGWGSFLRAFRDGGEELQAVGWRVALGGAVVHLLALVLFRASTGELPLVGLGPASSSLAFLIAVFALAVSSREAARPTVLFVLPLVMLLLGEALAVGVRPAAHQTAFRGPWFVGHVTVTFTAYAALVVASSAAAMYLLQFRKLKRKEFGSAFRFLPSLATLDRLVLSGLAVGLVALTLGLGAGWSWMLTYGRGLGLSNPQVIFGMVSWVLYLTALVVRILPGGSGRRGAATTFAAFGVSAIVFLGLRLTAGGGGFFL